jgi:hypothetical protein
VTSFYKGLDVKYKDHVGVVEFMCEQYITVCIRRMDHKSKDVCFLVYASQWEDIELINGNRQSYEK